MIFDVYQLSLYCISIYTVSTYVWMSPVYLFSSVYFLLQCYLVVTGHLAVDTGRWSTASNTRKWNAAGSWSWSRRYATKGRYDHQTFLVHPNDFSCKILDLLYIYINILFLLNRKDCQGCISKGYQSYDMVFAHHKTAWAMGMVIQWDPLIWCKAVGIFGGNQRLLHALQGRGAFVWSLS